MRLNQVGTPKSHRLLQESIIDPIKALTAGPMNQLRGALQSLSSTATASNESREGARKLQGEVVVQDEGRSSSRCRSGRASSTW